MCRVFARGIIKYRVNLKYKCIFSILLFYEFGQNNIYGNLDSMNKISTKIIEVILILNKHLTILISGFLHDQKPCFLY